MLRPRLQRRLHDPYPVQFVAGRCRVDVAWLDQVGIAQLGRCQAVTVVRHVQCLLAQQLPVIPVRRAIEHVAAVGGPQAGGAWAGGVIGDVRRPPYPPLTGTVHPGQARLGDLVQCLVHHHRITGKPRGRRHAVGEVIKYIALPQAGQTFGPGHFLTRAHQHEAAILQRRDAVGAQAVTHVAMPGQVVPDHLQAVGWPRKGDDASETAHTVALVIQLRLLGIAGGRCRDRVGYRNTAVGGIHRQAQAGWEAFEQGHLAVGKLTSVLPVVGGRDPV
ncbi:hypothetical protein D3C79_740690 [compost metagenome]